MYMAIPTINITNTSNSDRAKDIGLHNKSNLLAVDVYVVTVPTDGGYMKYKRRSITLLLLVASEGMTSLVTCSAPHLLIIVVVYLCSRQPRGGWRDRGGRVTLSRRPCDRRGGMDNIQVETRVVVAGDNVVYPHEELVERRTSCRLVVPTTTHYLKPVYRQQICSVVINVTKSRAL